MFQAFCLKLLPKLVVTPVYKVYSRCLGHHNGVPNGCSGGARAPNPANNTTKDVYTSAFFNPTAVRLASVHHTSTFIFAIKHGLKPTANQTCLRSKDYTNISTREIDVYNIPAFKNRSLASGVFIVVYDGHYASEMVFIKVQCDLALAFMGPSILRAKTTKGDGMETGPMLMMAQKRGFSYSGRQEMNLNDEGSPEMSDCATERRQCAPFNNAPLCHTRKHTEVIVT